MTPQELKNELHALGDVRGNINPRADFVHSTREHLLDTLQNTVADTKTRRFSFEHVWEAMSVVVPSRAVYSVVRPAVMIMTVFGLATGTWITGAFASLDSKSGELLYPVKLGIEKTTETVVGITQGEAAKTKVKAENLSRRVEEAQALVAEAAESGDADVAEHVDKTIERFKKDIAEVSQTLDELKGADLVAAIDVAKVVDETSEKIVEILDDTHEAIVSNNTMIPEEVKVIVAEAAEANAETEKKTVEVYLETLASGEEVISKEEVKEVIDKKIERIERAVDAAQEDAKNAAETVVTAPDTLQVDQTRVIDSSKEVEEATTEVKEALEEAKELLEGDDFTEVVKRVQELAPITQEVKVRAVEVEEAAKEIVENTETQSETETEVVPETSTTTPEEVEVFAPDTFTVEESDVKEVE